MKSIFLDLNQGLDSFMMTVQQNKRVLNEKCGNEVANSTVKSLDLKIYNKIQGCQNLYHLRAAILTLQEMEDY